MPSKPKIPKEEILKTALDILKRDGYGAINITSIAKTIGCSTQPISWQFGGMDGFRTELAEYAMKYTLGKIQHEGDNLAATFYKNGEACIDFAIDEPNVFQFVYMGGSNLKVNGGLHAFLYRGRDMKLQEGLADILGITAEQAAYFMDTMVIYVQGMASLIASGLVVENKETAHRMLQRTGAVLLKGFGVREEKITALFAQGGQDGR